MDSNLLLAFLAFGAACSSLWAWLIATASEQRQAMESLAQPLPSQERASLERAQLDRSGVDRHSASSPQG